jgi:hypothetical protein
MPQGSRWEHLLFGNKSKRNSGMKDTFNHAYGRTSNTPEKPWDLQPVELHPGDDITRLNEFSAAMKEKWIKGRQEHGTSFRTDPFEEAMNECKDLALYAEVLYFRIKALKERTVGNDKKSN